MATEEQIYFDGDQPVKIRVEYKDDRQVMAWLSARMPNGMPLPAPLPENACYVLDDGRVLTPRKMPGEGQLVLFSETQGVGPTILGKRKGYEIVRSDDSARGTRLDRVVAWTASNAKGDAIAPK